VIGRAIERNLGCGQSAQGIGESSAGWIQNGEMKQAGAIRRRRGAAKTFPGIEADVVVIAARRNERSLLTISLGQFETENAAIEAERALEVGDLQVDVAEANAGFDG
jgi:hypothetical protein